MYGGEEDIVLRQKINEFFQPSLGIENVFKDQMVTRIGICPQRSMEPVEKGHASVSPAKITTLEAFSRKHASVAQMIDRYVPEWFLDALLQRPRNG